MGEDERRLSAWVAAELGGEVVRITRLPRWRPAWDIDVEVGGRVVPLHARGEREPKLVMPFKIADEVPVHHLLEAHDVPVPHAYGLCDDPYALVMDRLRGNVDLSFAADDREREQLLEQYLEVLASIYAIPRAAIEEAGFRVPVDAADTALAGYWWPMLAEYDQAMVGLRPDPMAVFLRRWIEDNVPDGRLGMARFIPYDAFQFMFERGRITGLLDFEHAHVGDPLMDLAALRIRDTIKHIGELTDVGARYERTTGVTIDHEVVEFHTVVYNAMSVFSTAAPLAEPLPGTDWISYLAWYVNGARWAFECIAEIRGFTLERLAIPEIRPSKRAPALRHLVDGLRASAAARPGDHELAALGRLANHLKRADEIGPALDRDDLDELSEVLGHRPHADDADEELLALVERAGPEREEEVVRLLDRRAQRMHFVMASASSLMLRHPSLRSLRPDRPTVGQPDDGWPAGSIPGTR